MIKNNETLENSYFEMQFQNENNKSSTRFTKSIESSNESIIIYKPDVVVKKPVEPLKKYRKAASTWKQLGILTWKNLVLSKRNLCGLLTEIICPIFIMALLLLIRYFVTAVSISDQQNRAANVLDLFPLSNGTILVYYYPNSIFIQNTVTQAFSLIKSRKPFLNATS